jgi:ribosomal protein L35
MKTNKSYTKRIKITKNSKLVHRKPGQCHFNAKESRISQLDKKRDHQNLQISNKQKSRFLPGTKQK